MEFFKSGRGSSFYACGSFLGCNENVLITRIMGKNKDNGKDISHKAILKSCL